MTSVDLREIDLRWAYRRWHLLADVFRCFVRATAFTTLQQYPDFQLQSEPPVSEALKSRLNQILHAHPPENTLYYVDLSDAQTLEAAAVLHQQGIAPVLTLKAVLHPHGIVGSKSQISRLLTFPFENPPVTKAHGFILDSSRYGKEDRETLRGHFNNQYELTEEDLPAAEMLKHLGIIKCVYLYENDVKEDIASYLAYLKENGLDLKMIRISGDIHETD